MVKKEAKRLWSKHNVPMEIWSEILARLPVRSLVRFRCVSRSWKTVIDDPDFCRDHVERFKNNCDESHLLMVQGRRVQHCFVRCSDTMKTSRRLGHLGSWVKKTGEFKNTATPGFNGIWRLLFSVGLVMLKRKLHSELMLWNPSIRKCRLVRHSQVTGFLELGLGFDPLIKDYKIVRVSRNTPSSVEIYTVGTASWKTVAAQGTVSSSWLQNAYECQSIYFKGCLYNLSLSKLISFDLSKEVFKSLGLPEYDNSAHDSLALVDMWSSLAVLHFSTHGASLWVLDDNAAAAASPWSIRCTFATSISHFLYLKKNGDMIYNKNSFHVVYFKNIHTEEEKIVTNVPTITTDILGYKESLVLLK